MASHRKDFGPARPRAPREIADAMELALRRLSFDPTFYVGPNVPEATKLYLQTWVASLLVSTADWANGLPCTFFLDDRARRDRPKEKP